jgi:hypothetical protein
LVLLGWRGPRPITTFFLESVADEVFRLVECPVAVTVISESPVEQVVLAISKDDLIVSRLDVLRSAVNIAKAVALHEPLIVGPVDNESLSEAGIILPEKAKFKSGDTDIIPWIEQTSQKNSLVVCLTGGWAFDRIAADIHQLNRSAIVMITN